MNQANNVKPQQPAMTKPPFDPYASARLTPEQLKKLSPQEKEKMHHTAFTTLARIHEVEIAQTLVKAAEHGCELEGKFVEKPSIEDIVVMVVSTESEYPIKKLLEARRDRGERSLFLLRDRATLSQELKTMRLPQGAMIGGGNRAERRAAAERVDRFPWAALGKTISERLRNKDGDEANNHWVVVLGDQVLGGVLPFHFDLEETKNGLAEEQQKNTEKPATIAAAPVSPDGTGDGST